MCLRAWCFVLVFGGCVTRRFSPYLNLIRLGLWMDRVLEHTAHPKTKSEQATAVLDMHAHGVLLSPAATQWAVHGVCETCGTRVGKIA
jgi:hypothetical protein